jgi:hypothetical protein
MPTKRSRNHILAETLRLPQSLNSFAMTKERYCLKKKARTIDEYRPGISNMKIEVI